MTPVAYGGEQRAALPGASRPAAPGPRMLAGAHRAGRVLSGPALQPARSRSAAASSGATRTRTGSARRRVGVAERAQWPAAPASRSNAAVVPGRLSASTSARASIARLIVFCTGLASRRPHRGQGQHQRHHLRVAGVRRAAAPAAAADDAAPSRPLPSTTPDRPEHGADHHVVVPGVAELVGDDRQRLVLGHVLDQVVVEHHPPGAAEAGDVRVQRRRTTRRVGHQHVVDGTFSWSGELEDLACAASRPAQRGEVVEERLDHHRVDERADQDDATPRTPPATAGQARRQRRAQPTRTSRTSDVVTRATSSPLSTSTAHSPVDCVESP